MYVCMYSVQKCLLPVWLHVCPYISRCQAGAKFCKEYKSHTVPARRDCIFIIALPWGHINAPVQFVLGRALTCCTAYIALTQGGVPLGFSTLYAIQH